MVTSDAALTRSMNYRPWNGSRQRPIIKGEPRRESSKEKEKLKTKREWQMVETFLFPVRFLPSTSELKEGTWFDMTIISQGVVFDPGLGSIFAVHPHLQPPSSYHSYNMSTGNSGTRLVCTVLPSSFDEKASYSGLDWHQSSQKGPQMLRQGWRCHQTDL
ncbi:hypothetical protein NCU16719 [Neurospora crassa OR74A]|uniref:Uncharacterized protein n=1 Tax=Neurospora crassa (strain ATCC 24698 / 74-OR23-1A / CBS 708.71 / DSM 1257 / FGSC 987) TaxID=367110 RepID=V5INL2_NEUCR|nr:hypothetical protein NCU16719 [Neurospora crassa OR74A]ESA42749.1 hypothetical protein NCU16719 [Neurospora crassa OR74A]|eukprot:XP_011394350.1 hypothetical protein NCU16719 [Neurospora crassa OR74A]